MDLVFSGCWLVGVLNYPIIHLLSGLFLDVSWYKSFEGLGVGFIQVSFGWAFSGTLELVDYLIWSWFGLFLNEPPGFGWYKSFEGLGVGFVQLSFGLFLDVGWYVGINHLKVWELVYYHLVGLFIEPIYRLVVFAKLEGLG